MDRLDRLHTFVEVAERSSFSEAARSRRISAAAASRAVSTLEEDLGVVLFRRTTRSVALTAEGAAYLERCRAALADLDHAARSLRGENAAPGGPLVITAPVLYGRLRILPVVVDLLRAHAALDLRLTLTDRVVRLVDEGIDVAVRIGDLSDSALHAVRLAETRRVLVASPAYLSRREAPARITDLAAHDLIAAEAFAPAGEWRFGGPDRPSLHIAPRLVTNSVEAAIDAALAGLGITRALCYQVRDHVEAGRLAYVLADRDPPPAPVSAVFQANRSRSPNVRAFLDAAKKLPK